MLNYKDTKPQYPRTQRVVDYSGSGFYRLFKFDDGTVFPATFDPLRYNGKEVDEYVHHVFGVGDTQQVIGAFARITTDNSTVMHVVDNSRAMRLMNRKVDPSPTVSRYKNKLVDEIKAACQRSPLSKAQIVEAFDEVRAYYEKKDENEKR